MNEGAGGMSDWKSGYPVATSVFDRTIILGNTASGKSWLSCQLGEALSLAVFELDRFHWVDGGFDSKETTPAAIAKTVQKAELDKWVIEGTYGWLIRPVIHRATCLLWTDLAWEEIRTNLKSREHQRGIDGNFPELEAWAKGYWQRETSSSHETHLTILEQFERPIFRLRGRQHVSGFVAAAIRA